MKKQTPRRRCWNCKFQGNKFNIPFSGIHHHCELLIEKAKAEYDTFISMKRPFDKCSNHQFKEINNGKS